MNTKVLSLILVICGTLLFDSSHAWSQQSIKSWVFEPLRPKEPPKRISAECGSVITDAYGRLEKTYKRGEVADGSKCTWTLRAPANHVVNVIAVGFDFEDKTAEPSPQYYYTGSNISIRDDKAGRELRQYTVNEYQQSGHGSGFEHSYSSKEELVVEIVYHDNVVNAVQKIYIEYEFLNLDDVNRLLRENKFAPVQ